jgi:hypothetical protein
VVELATHAKRVRLPGALQSVAAQQVAAGEVGDGQRVTVAPIGEHELALVVGTPKIVRSGCRVQGRSLGLVADSMLTVGTVSNVPWKSPYLVADLAVWDSDAIAAVQNESQRELSCGYRYKAIMVAGKVKGEAFDGRMVDIIGNHVALVAAGRVGSDVVVRDEALGVPMHVAFANWNSRLVTVLTELHQLESKQIKSQ